MTAPPTNRSLKLAAVTTDRVVYLFDDQGERKDKFKCVRGGPRGLWPIG